MDQLRRATYREMLARDYWERCQADVWREFERVDPALAMEVEKLGLTDQGSAAWICPNPFEGESSPAELVVEGKRDKVIAKIQHELALCLSEAESRHLVNEIDLPFQPNAKLASALRTSECHQYDVTQKLSSTECRRHEIQPDEAHIAYCQYFATGEGVSIFIALGGSYNHAESVFKKHVPEYYHPGVIIHSLELRREGMEQISPLLPQSVLDLMINNPNGTTDYFSIVHYNLS